MAEQLEYKVEVEEESYSPTSSSLSFTTSLQALPVNRELGDDVVLQKCYRVTVRVLPWHSIASHKELRRQSIAVGAPARRLATAAHVERRWRGGVEAATAAADTEANKKLFLFDL